MRALERERDCVCPSNVKRERGVLCSVGCVDIRRDGQIVVSKKLWGCVSLGMRLRGREGGRRSFVWHKMGMEIKRVRKLTAAFEGERIKFNVVVVSQVRWVGIGRRKKPLKVTSSLFIILSLHLFSDPSKTHTLSLFLINTLSSLSLIFCLPCFPNIIFLCQTSISQRRKILVL